ncbi:unnamed protein product [Ectocarpus sp. 4 AP-2014]
MWRWFTYEEEYPGEESKNDLNHILRQTSSNSGRLSAQAPHGGSSSNSGIDSDSDVAPTFDKLDPLVTAATLAQAAFRGYRLRERLRRLPAREAEKHILGLHNNARGFRRVGLFLLFSGLYFALVFYGVDVSFQRSVQQALRDHVAGVKYGPDLDKTHNDVASLADVHQWVQAFYLKTYDGTQLEHPCTPCAIKPPDDVCDACDFAPLFEMFANDSDSSAADAVGSEGESSSGVAAVAAWNGRRKVATTSGDSSSSSSSSSTFGLSEECVQCLIALNCVGVYLEKCEEVLGLPSSNTTALSSATTSDAAAANFSALLEELDLEPLGGVRASGGYVTVENVDYSGNGYVGDRNRAIGGMLVTFTRRNRLSSDECSSSSSGDYYDICLADEGTNKTTYSPPQPWGFFRPDEEMTYSAVASGYPVLVDTGGFDIGLNFGYCTLLVMEDLDVIPRDEVRSVNIQLVTYNGNQGSAFGSINIGFTFDHGGEVEANELVTAYILTGNAGQGSDRIRWILGLIFVCLTLAMIRHDTRKWYRARRAKARRNKCHCCCGFTFFTLIVLNVLMWLGWASLGKVVANDVVLQGTSSEEDSVLDALVGQVLALQEAALFSWSLHIIFLLTTLAGLYRWIFQARDRPKNAMKEKICSEGMLTFHKRMSIVTDTLSRASTHLDHFLFVFFLVILAFAALTWLLVGSSTKEFSTLEDAWRSVTRISLGESENFYPQILDAQPTVGPVVVVLYQVLGVVLLLNVVIAILLEAYRGVVSGMRGEDTIFQSFIAFVGMSWCSLKTRIRWATACIRWRLGGRRNTSPQDRPRRPSLKTFLQGSTGVCGVDGRPVVMVRRPPESSTIVGRQLSFNCPRYITVGWV